MEKRILTSIMLFAAFSFCHAQGLKDCYSKYFKIGVAVNQRNVRDSLQQALVCKEFNSVTAENDFKPQPTEPREGEFRWEGADRIANFCRTNGIKMRGHCLLWHNQIGEWMFYDENHNLVSKEVLYERMKKHINAIMKRYADVVYAWDVVNEAFTDNPNAPHPYRESLFYKIAGDEFIKKAFIFAREADPNALLFYNDYNEVNPVKRDRICEMVRTMKAEGVPIDGIGMQAHYNIYWPKEEEFEAAIKKFAEVVDHIHITELDLRTNTEHGGDLQFSQGEGGITPELQKLQDEQYDMLFRVMRRNHEKIDCVTFWNLGDRDSWLGAKNYPLLFDYDYNRKSSYDRVTKF